MISFSAIESPFLFKLKFLVLFADAVSEKKQTTSIAAPSKLLKLNIFLVSEVSWTWIVAIVLYAATILETLLFILPTLRRSLFYFLSIRSLKVFDRRSFYWFAEAVVWLLPAVAAPQRTNRPTLLFRSLMVCPDFRWCFLFAAESIVHPPSAVAATYWSILLMDNS